MYKPSGNRMHRYLENQKKEINRTNIRTNFSNVPTTASNSLGTVSSSSLNTLVSNSLGNSSVSNVSNVTTLTKRKVRNVTSKRVVYNNSLSQNAREVAIASASELRNIKSRLRKLQSMTNETSKKYINVKNKTAKKSIEALQKQFNLSKNELYDVVKKIIEIRGILNLLKSKKVNSSEVFMNA